MRTTVGVPALTCDVAAEAFSPRPSAGEPPPAALDPADAAIVVIEARSFVRDCVASCIASLSGQRVLTFASVQDYLEVAQGVPASLVLLCNSANPIAAAEERERERLARLVALSPVVILSDGEDVQEIRDAIGYGARGYIPTSLKLAVAIEAIRLVRAGGVYVPAASLIAPPQAVPSARSNQRGRKSSGLTARQAAVLEAVAKGKANKVIASELSMRESTVKVHVRRIMKKLSAKNRTEAALMANGLLNRGDKKALKVDSFRAAAGAPKVPTDF